MAWLRATLVPEYVKIPESDDEVRQAECVFAGLGFPGAICSTDGVQLRWNACPAVLTWQHEGKEGYPTRGFNVSVLHSRKIIHVTD
eukprot:788805-Pleurochrysis_carterae.AAC.1